MLRKNELISAVTSLLYQRDVNMQDRTIPYEETARKIVERILRLIQN